MSAIFGADAKPLSPDEERRLGRFLVKRRLVWILFWSVLPVVWLASLADLDPIQVGRIWILAFGVALVWQGLSRCPRCNEPVRVGRLSGAFWAEQCRSCGLRLRRLDS